MAYVGGSTCSQETQAWNMMNICTKYGFDILITSGSYSGHRRHTRHTTPGVQNKLPTGELNYQFST